MESNDPIVSVSMMVRRFEKHRDYFREKARRLPWWAWKRRHYFRASAAVYEYEIECVLKYGGASVLKRLLDK